MSSEEEVSPISVVFDLITTFRTLPKYRDKLPGVCNAEPEAHESITIKDTILVIAIKLFQNLSRLCREAPGSIFLYNVGFFINLPSLLLFCCYSVKCCFICFSLFFRGSYNSIFVIRRRINGVYF